MRLGILASHEGTTLQAVLDGCASGVIPAKVATIISNNSESGALRRARTAGLHWAHLSSRTHPDPKSLDLAICQTLQQREVDFVLLAGYMRRLGPVTLQVFRGRVLNTHPALLPKFGGQGMYGLRVHQAVLAAREATTGVSVHRVDAEYDAGPVIAQTVVQVQADDTPETLAARVQQREREFLVEVLAGLATGRVELPAPGS
ncbi:phosphoribosylglycinamide formyltransferase [Myxococcota bacterium]